jgi:UDP-N-acetylglucosamine 2-epimerase (non-hydrolysing)
MPIVSSRSTSSNSKLTIGSPLFEVYNFHNSQIEKSTVLKKISLSKNQYVLASIHREENVDNINNLKLIFDSIIKLKEKLNVPVIFSAHPRILKKIKEYKIKIDKKINFYKPFGIFDYIKLMKNSKLVLSDSGSITEETSILSIPAINLRNNNERQEGMERGITIMSGLNSKDIINSANIILTKSKDYNFRNDIYPDYSVPNVSDTVVNIIQSYTHYINKKFWFKS